MTKISFYICYLFSSLQSYRFFFGSTSIYSQMTKLGLIKGGNSAFNIIFTKATGNRNRIGELLQNIRLDIFRHTFHPFSISIMKFIFLDALLLQIPPRTYSIAVTISVLFIALPECFPFHRQIFTARNDKRKLITILPQLFRSHEKLQQISINRNKDHVIN